MLIKVVKKSLELNFLNTLYIRVVFGISYILLTENF